MLDLNLPSRLFLACVETFYTSTRSEGVSTYEASDSRTSLHRHRGRGSGWQLRHENPRDGGCSAGVVAGADAALQPFYSGLPGDPIRGTVGTGFLAQKCYATITHFC